MSSLFDALGSNNKGSECINPIQAVQQLKNNPAAFMKSRGFNVPDGVDMRNPQSIINGLIQTGQISNNRYQQVMQFMNGMRKR